MAKLNNINNINNNTRYSFISATMGEMFYVAPPKGIVNIGTLVK